MKDRKKNRLDKFHYDSWYFFVTINVKDNKKVFGEVIDDKIILNEYGKIVEKCIYDLPSHYKDCHIWDFVIMPNHIHTIIILEDSNFVRNGLKPFPTHKHWLSEIIRWLKTFSSRKINDLKNNIFFQRQKSFYDHIIRNEEDMNRIIEYIQLNPYKRENDEYYIS